MSGPPKSPRLNPFGFPSNIDFYLVLIVVAALAGTLFIFNWLWFGIPGNIDRFDRAIAECGAATGAFRLIDMAGMDPETVEALANASDAALLCRAGLETEIATLMAAGVLILVVVAAGIYFTYPARKRRSANLRSLNEQDVPDVVAAISELSAEAEVARQPSLLWNPLNPGVNAFVFGRLGSYYLALSGGLVTKHMADPPTFRAVILHELGHLRNKDVDKSYLSLSLWQAFVVAGLVPLAVGIISGFIGSLPRVPQIGWRVTVLTLLVYLSRNAVLRARELYADVRASAWDGPDGAVKSTVEGLPERSARGLQRLFRKHPSTGERAQLLTDTESLFSVSAWAAFATGLIAMIAFPSLWKWLSILTTGFADIRGGFAVTFATTLIIAPFIVGVVGIGVWRMTFAAWAGGSRRKIRVGGLALALTLGLLMGEIVSFESFIHLAAGGLPYLTYQPSSALGLISAYLAMGVLSLLLLAAIFAFLRWISTGSLGWLKVAAWSRSPRAEYWAVFVISAGLLTLLLVAFSSLRELVMSAGAEISTVEEFLLLSTFAVVGLPIFILQQPLTVLALVLLWAYPLSAWLVLRRREPATTSPWVYLDRRELPPRLSEVEPLRFRFGFTRGLYAGILLSVIVLAARFLLTLIFPEAVRETDTYALIVGFGQVGLAIAAQVVVAVSVARATNLLSLEHGLYAAFIGGVAMTIGMQGVNIAFGGSPDAASTWQTLSMVVSGGALLSIFAVLVMFGLRRVIGAFRGTAPEPALEA